MSPERGTRVATQSTARDSGTVGLRGLAIHWSVCKATARAITTAHGLPDVSASGWPKYRWSDIWRLEGAGLVPPCDWTDFRKPLLRASELAAIDSKERSARTWRRHVEAGRMPSIRLSDTVRRVRESTFLAMAPYV
jgi:hypothetical protein